MEQRIQRSLTRYRAALTSTGFISKCERFFYAGQVSNETILIELPTTLTTLGELNGQQEERVLCSLYIVFLYKERIQIF